MQKNLLIVDDDVMILALFKEAFSAEGYNVQTATNAGDALTIVDKTPPPGIPVMLFDLNLPGSMSGVDLCREIRKRNHIGIIFAVTGYASLFQLADCREAGFDEYFLKPVSLRTLKTEVAQAFQRIERWVSK